MAAPAIALRFRDTTYGIDTIVEHRAILARGGAVGWGWWKKTYEPDRGKEIAALLAEAGGSLGIVILDRSTERAFLCRCAGYRQPFEADPETVPAYYRDRLELTAGVFELTSIEDIPFDPELGGMVGDRTYLLIGSGAERASHLAAPAEAPGRSCVLHLSDLHFGADYGFRLQGETLPVGDGRRTLTECIVADLERLGVHDDIAAIVVTGDFMTKGRFDDASREAALREFEALRERLRLAREQIIPVPGNHDVVRYPEGAQVDLRENAVDRQATYQHETDFRGFVSQLVGRRFDESLNYVRRIRLGQADLDVCVINSCTIVATEWTEYGYAGMSGLDTIVELGAQPVERPTYRFLALHHHLLPVAGVEAPCKRGVTLTLDASDILAAGQRAGVHVALHGHQHRPKATLYQSLGLNGEETLPPIYVVANGSAGAKKARLPGSERNTFCVFRLREDGIDLMIRELRPEQALGADIYRGTLAAAPVRPQAAAARPASAPETPAI